RADDQAARRRDRDRGHRSRRRARHGASRTEPRGRADQPGPGRGARLPRRADEELAQTMNEPLDEVRVPVESDTDIVTARQRGRALATRLGLSSGDATIVATAISELARNIVLYANHGEVILRPVENGSHVGLIIIARDEGEGISDIRQA